MTIPIPLADRSKGDPRNVIGVILDRNENDMFRIAVREGIVIGHYRRSQLVTCTQQLYSIGDVNADKERGLHQAVQQSSCTAEEGTEGSSNSSTHTC